MFDATKVNSLHGDELGFYYQANDEMYVAYYYTAEKKRKAIKLGKFEDMYDAEKAIKKQTGWS